MLCSILGRRSVPRLAVPSLLHRTLFIQTKTTPNPDAVKFIPTGHTPILGAAPSSTSTSTSQRSYEFLNARDASRTSPLARTLFRVSGVKHVMLTPEFVTITKHEDVDWQIMKPDLYAAIMDFYTAATPQPAIIDGESSTRASDAEAGAGDQNVDSLQILEGDSETVQQIKELLDTRIRPAIQSDGGDIDLVSFTPETGIVRLRLRGACRTCDSSVVTLKRGVEGMLMHYVAEVTGVEQVVEKEDVVVETEFERVDAEVREKENSTADKEQAQ